MDNPFKASTSFFQELSESEAVLAKNDLKLALKRIEDLHQAITGELDSGSDSDNRFWPSIHVSR